MAHVYISIGKRVLMVCRCLPTDPLPSLSTQTAHNSPLCLQLGLADSDGEAGTCKSQRMGAQRGQVFLRSLQQAHYGF